MRCISIIDTDIMKDDALLVFIVIILVTSGNGDFRHTLFRNILKCMTPDKRFGGMNDIVLFKDRKNKVDVVSCFTYNAKCTIKDNNLVFSRFEYLFDERLIVLKSFPNYALKNENNQLSLVDRNLGTRVIRFFDFLLFSNEYIMVADVSKFKSC